jgi:acetyltransferase-like isoleucine patch superfamily enzyme
MRFMRRLFQTRPAVYLVSLLDLLETGVNRYRVQARLQRLFPGKIVHSDITVEFKYPENIECGNFVLIGPYSTIGAMAKVTLEDHVRISRGVCIETAGLDLRTALPYQHMARPIHIGRGAWIGMNAVILGGVSIVESAVVAAGAVVTRNVPPHSVVAGIPARVIHSLRQPATTQP